MARSDRLFKRCFNDALDLLATDQAILSISELADYLNVSRNTARRVRDKLADRGLLRAATRGWRRARAPRPADYYPDSAVRTTDERLEELFMQKILNEELVPKSRINEAALAKELGVSTSAVREFLLRLSRFEFIRKEPQRSWVLEGFTEDYAEELHEVRVLFELRSIEKLIALPEDDRFWPMLLRVHNEHKRFLGDYETCYMDFPALDTRFHRFLNQASNNRFFANLQDAIALVFHYHYRWNKFDEKERNQIAAQEHIAIVEALLIRDRDGAEAAFRTHLNSARRSLIASLR